MTQWGIDTLFNPGKRHMDEEKRRLQSTREEVGDSSGGKRIDLEGGKVRLAGRPDRDPDQRDPDQREHDADLPDGAEAEAEAASEEPEPEEADTPAARARRRRRAAG